MGNLRLPPFATNSTHVSRDSGALILTVDESPGRLAGLYRFLEDGWRGRLLLSHQGGRILTGRYATERYLGEFDAVAEVVEGVANQLHIRISDFNEMDEQLFEGYIFQPDGNALAGVTYAEGTTFGFCARRTRSLILAQYRMGDVRPEDFAGTYVLHQEDDHGVLSLDVVSGSDLRGVYRPWAGQRSLPVTARIDDAVPHGIRLSIEEASLAGYLFTRPKNVVAGRVEDAGESHGFYMIKMSQSTGNVGNSLDAECLDEPS